ncbi:MAG: DUF1329 domain-containing protein [Desulfatitalea sp.]|nr:DUF1329 domain-containing protein [Desulfatitalea sp.]
MRQPKSLIACLVFVFALSGIFSTGLLATEAFEIPTVNEFVNKREFYDDPTPWRKSDTFDYKKFLPPEVYDALSYDVETMKKLWADLIGFKAPDLVNKVAPEIKPGTYSYKDKEQHPGLKALMTEYHYNRFKPGGKPFAGNFPEMKIVPTRQYYYSIPVAEATKTHMGQTKLDEKTGIIKEETWVAGTPFPKPAGRFIAYQVYYNWLKRYAGWDNKYLLSNSRGWTKSLKEDNLIVSDTWEVRLKGRVVEPYGWFDERAKEQGESSGLSFRLYAPRDSFGNVIAQVKYLDPDKFDQMMFYVSMMRRVRLMSSTDVQDSIGGGDAIYYDGDGVQQKPSTTIFPSELELIAEKELLFPSSHDGGVYLTSPSKGLELHGLEWERRPVYVIQMKIHDKNFVYGHRILYIDKETFFLLLGENYDQKGRLYRTFDIVFNFIPEMGVANFSETVLIDHQELHSTIGQNYFVPVPWITRDKIGLEYLYKSGK